MAVRVSWTLTGIGDYLERIRKAGQDVDAAAGRAVQAGGAVLLDGMKRRVRKDTHNLEQHLEESPVNQDGNLVSVEVGMSRDVDADTARYGNAQEYGTSSMAAQSYIRATVDNDGAKARRAMRESLESEGVL